MYVCFDAKCPNRVEEVSSKRSRVREAIEMEEKEKERRRSNHVQTMDSVKGNARVILVQVLFSLAKSNHQKCSS